MKLYNQTSLKISQIITRNYSTSFYFASLFYSKSVREAIFSIYGFVRFADEIVDTFHRCNQKKLLDDFIADLNNALNFRISLNPVLHAFQLTVKKYEIERQLIDAFLDSMRNDLIIKNYQTKKEIDKYIYGSAEVVGLMCLRVFCQGNETIYNELKYPAVKLGAAFQKVNFLRDLKADMQDLQRSYFPQINDTFDENTKQEIIKDIQNDFAIARNGIRKLPGNTKVAVYIAYFYYKALLKKLQRIPAHQIINRRVRISNTRKVLLTFKAVVFCKLNLIK